LLSLHVLKCLLSLSLKFLANFLH